MRQDKNRINLIVTTIIPQIMAAHSIQKNQLLIEEAVRAIESGARIPMCDEYEKMISGMP